MNHGLRIVETLAADLETTGGNMVYQFPMDIDDRIKALLASGDFRDENEVLREAVQALEHRRQEVAAIMEGWADVEAGRVRPFEEIDAEIRGKFGFRADE